jgi:porin
MGYQSLDAVAPRARAELYQLWYRQELFDKRLIVRVGKSVPTYDFTNVSRPVPSSDPSRFIPTVSSAILTPLYNIPTQLGFIPGYYNSATGIVASFVPNNQYYVNAGVFDGNLARGRQTGLEGPHFNGYYFYDVEAGINWEIGPDRLPGKVAAGYWWQTGELAGFGGGLVHGAEGVYLFGSQRLFYERPGVSDNGLSGYYQFGYSGPSNVVFVPAFFGAGLTYFGPLPGRDSDSAGFAMAYGFMSGNPNAGADFAPPNAGNGPFPLADHELILTWYYQLKVKDGCFLQPNLSYIVSPAQQPGIPDGLAVTLRAIILF